MPLLVQSLCLEYASFLCLPRKCNSFFKTTTHTSSSCDTQFPSLLCKLSPFSVGSHSIWCRRQHSIYNISLCCLLQNLTVHLDHSRCSVNVGLINCHSKFWATTVSLSGSSSSFSPLVTSLIFCPSELSPFLVSATTLLDISQIHLHLGLEKSIEDATESLFGEIKTKI